MFTDAQAIPDGSIHERTRSQLAVVIEHAFEWRHQWLAACGEHRQIIASTLTVFGLDVLSSHVELFHARARKQTHAVAIIPLRWLGHDDVRGISAEHLAELNAVVCTAWLVSEDGDFVQLVGAARDEVVEQAASAHSVTNDGELLFRHLWEFFVGGCSSYRVSLRCVSLSCVSSGVFSAVALTAQILNSGMRLIGSRAGMVRMLAACFPPQ